MIKLKMLLLIVLLLESSFGAKIKRESDISQYNFSIVGLRKDISEPNLLTNKNSYFITDVKNPNDSIQQQQIQTNASKVTFGKIALESVGAGISGFLFTYTLSKIAPVINSFDTWWIAVPFLGPTIGTSLGTTLTGNQLMHPHGSFIKSLIGSSIGSLLSAPIAYFAILSGYEPTPLTYIGLFTAITLPISGSVIGYNSKRTGCCMASLQNENLWNFEESSNNTKKYFLKIEILSIKF